MEWHRVQLLLIQTDVTDRVMAQLSAVSDGVHVDETRTYILSPDPFAAFP